MIWTCNDAQEEEGGIRRVNEGDLEATVVNQKTGLPRRRKQWICNGRRADRSLGTNSTINPRRLANRPKDGWQWVQVTGMGTRRIDKANLSESNFASSICLAECSIKQPQHQCQVGRRMKALKGREFERSKKTTWTWVSNKNRRTRMSGVLKFPTPAHNNGDDESEECQVEGRQPLFWGELYKMEWRPRRGEVGRWSRRTWKMLAW